MKSLQIQAFRGSETVASNKELQSNAVFMSKVKEFEGPLSKSHYAIKFPLNGNENYILNGKKFTIGPSHYLMTNAGQEMDGDVQSETPVIGICVLFSKDHITHVLAAMTRTFEEELENPFDPHHSPHFISKTNHLSQDRLSTMIHSIKNEVAAGTIDDQYEEESFFLTLSELLINEQLRVYSDIARLPQAKFSTREEIYRRVCIMEDYLQSNYKNDITLDELSQNSCLSKFHAIRCYQKIYNISPYQKIQLLRLKNARQLILEGMPLKEVANETNFTDHRALSRQFKKHFNMTPSQFKRVQ